MKNRRSTGGLGRPARARYAYQVVADDILRRIRAGEWPEGQRLPAVNELEPVYKQSHVTVYRAVRYLADRGHLTIYRGSGTFVRAHHIRQRVAVLGGAALVDPSAAPFLSQAVRHAHACFARLGMDAQVYVEDLLASSGLPTGLRQELEQKKIQGLLTIDSLFPYRHMLSREWKEHAVPHVAIGATDAPHRVYIDRRSFLDRAVAAAAKGGRKRIALLERREHLAEHAGYFRERCRAQGVEAYTTPPSWPRGSLSYEEYGFDLIHRVWSGARKPQAFVVPDDTIAKGIAQGAMALGIRVPETAQIIVMTNRGVRMFYPVPVVSFEVDVEAVVTTAARMLIDMFDKAPPPPRTILIPPVMAPAREEARERKGARRPGSRPCGSRKRKPGR